jgi:hypothetical protein
VFSSASSTVVTDAADRRDARGAAGAREGTASGAPAGARRSAFELPPLDDDEERGGGGLVN